MTHGKTKRFSKPVADKLQFYVYRLIDPRNGETFYVGKGTGNRVFAHVKGQLNAEGDELTEKLHRIREIQLDGFEVAHVVHRHGMTEDRAVEVEAALIDAYPEVTNQVSGTASDERGLMHVNQIIERYEAKEAIFKHKAVVLRKIIRVPHRAVVPRATPPVGGVKSPHRQPSSPRCRSFLGDQESCAPVQLGAGKKEDRNRRSRFGSGADSDSTDR